MTRHPQVVQSPVSDYCLKLIFDDQKKPQILPKLLLRVSVRELHNSLVSYPNYLCLQKARDEENNIIIIDSTLRTLLPPQFF